VIGTFGAALTVGLKRGGLLLSLLVLPLYVPTLIFGAEVARRGAEGLAVQTPLLMLAGSRWGRIALLPFAARGDPHQPALSRFSKPGRKSRDFGAAGLRPSGHEAVSCCRGRGTVNVPMSLWEYANPKKFIETSDRVLPWVTGLAVICLVVGLVWGFFFTPDDFRQGSTVKIIYLHVPSR
jgi:hypothetical protein